MTNEEIDNAREIEAIRIYDLEQHNPKSHGLARIAARLAREGWMPPAPVDPDKEEAITLAKGFGMAHYIPVLEAIKRGRELERQEAKPGMVWVKRDWQSTPPVVQPEAWVLHYAPGSVPMVKWSTAVDWNYVAYYCLIRKPEDAT